MKCLLRPGTTERLCAGEGATQPLILKRFTVKPHWPGRIISLHWDFTAYSLPGRSVEVPPLSSLVSGPRSNQPRPSPLGWRAGGVIKSRSVQGASHGIAAAGLGPETPFPSRPGPVSAIRGGTKFLQRLNRGAFEGRSYLSSSFLLAKKAALRINGNSSPAGLKSVPTKRTG